MTGEQGSPRSSSGWQVRLAGSQKSVSPQSSSLSHAEPASPRATQTSSSLQRMSAGQRVASAVNPQALPLSATGRQTPGLTSARTSSRWTRGSR
ncbi:hypothetical protein [Nannocystis pusilla]|uniref:hypothetical protein n=1 Tax=Nannocystis pusilla TaxID=889268 RepID=UPI003B777C06